MTKNSNGKRNLRIEIWMNDNLEWSLQGDGSEEQYARASIKLASLFPGEEELRLVFGKEEVRSVKRPEAVSEIKRLNGARNVMLCDPGYERMMVFIYD